jgi:hypothetical protein
MTTQSSTPAATRIGLGAVIVARVRIVVPLVVLSLAIFAASAQAHTVSPTAVCNSVTFHWTEFASSGDGNHGHNTPGWTVVFTPTGGAPTTTGGNVSFDGSSFSLTVPIAGGNGTVTASSSWTSGQTRDGDSNSYSKNLTISDCPPPPTVTPPPPPTVTKEQATVATQLVEASCVPSPVVLRGLAAKVRRSLSVHVTAVGVKSVTFYLDGRKLATVTKPKNQRFSIKISARNLGYGRHRLQAKAQMRNATCATAAASAAFVKVKAAAIERPLFTG